MKDRSISIKKNIFYNLLYTFIKWSFPLITYPYVARILGVEGMGQYNFVSAVIGYFALFASLEISTYAIRDGIQYREDKEKMSLFASQIFTINLLATIFAMVMLNLSILLIPRLKSVLWLLEINSITILANLMSIDWINNIYEDFRYIAIRNILVQLLSTILTFSFVHSAKDLSLYMVIMTFSGAAAGIINSIYVRRYVYIKICMSKKLLQKHMKSIMIFWGGSIATSIYMNIDTLMLGFMKDDISIGLYSAATKITRMVLQLIVAVNVVLLPRLSLNADEKNNKLLQMDIGLIMPIGIGLYATSEMIIPIFCGLEYEKASLPMQILSISLIFSSLNNCLANQYIIPKGYEKLNLISTIVGASINFLLNIFFIYRWSHVGAALTTLISEIIVFIIFVWWGSKKMFTLSFSSFKYLLSSIFFILIVKIIRAYIWNNIIGLIMSVIICTIFYLIVLIVSKDFMLRLLFARRNN